MARKTKNSTSPYSAGRKIKVHDVVAYYVPWKGWEYVIVLKTWATPDNVTKNRALVVGRDGEVMDMPLVTFACLNELRDWLLRE